jgi:hypothetical protein
MIVTLDTEQAVMCVYALRSKAKDFYDIGLLDIAIEYLDLAIAIRIDVGTRWLCYTELLDSMKALRTEYAGKLEKERG